MTSVVKESIKREGLFSIAEVSCNHCFREDLLDLTISNAFNIGRASAVKLQSSTPDCLSREFNGKEFFVNEPSSPWHGKHLYELYKETCTPLSWPIEKINAYKDNGTIFSTPFSPQMVDLLEDSCCPSLYKISGIDWDYFELIAKCVGTGKEVLVSLTDPTLQWPVLTKVFGDCLTPMYCISKYPSAMPDVIGSQLSYLRSQVEIFGFSDHSVDHRCAAYAVAAGARIIEKHVKNDSSVISPDSHFSCTPEQFRACIEECLEIIAANNRDSRPTSTIHIGRSIYLERDLPAGTCLKREHLAVIRPGGGLSARFLTSIIGKKLLHDGRRGQRLSLDDIVRDSALD